MTNDGVPVAKESKPFAMEVTPVDCSTKISFSINEFTNLDIDLTSGASRLLLADGSFYASTVSTVACPITYSLVLVSGTTLGSWLQIDASTGEITLDTNTIGSSSVKINLASTNSASVDSNVFTVAVECPDLVVNTITGPSDYVFTYPATTGGALSDVVTLSSAHEASICAVTYSLVD
jgi:hypothetical protein